MHGDQRGRGRESEREHCSSKSVVVFLPRVVGTRVYGVVGRSVEHAELLVVVGEKGVVSVPLLVKADFPVPHPDHSGCNC